MQLLSAQNLSLTFVTDDIFRDVSFLVQDHSHIGLVGANGAGKTSLFRLITGELTPGSGQLVRARDCRVAYLEQFLDAAEDDSLYQATLKVFAPLLALEQRLEQVIAQLGDSGDPALLQEQSRLQELFADQGGYTFRGRSRGALLGLGFDQADLDLPISALSGGQRSKAALAKVLLAPADILLLDEPTNHLDIDSIHWLETYLASYKGAFILISHDRYFLDQVAGEIWSLSHQRLRRWPGNYSDYVRQERQEAESLRHRYENQLREIRRVEAIIEQQRRFNQARNYITIASKEKQLARLRAELVLPEADQRELSFSFTTPPPGGNEVLDLHAVAKSYGGRSIFREASLRLTKGERVFLLGPNGCGKTTLMKIILGQVPADTGTVRLGVNIFPAYYDQLHHHLSGPQTLLEHFTEEYPRLTQTQLRTMLGSFLFPGDAVYKTLDMLSGGEKARLELMKLILRPANLLLLDEPTNHLDIAGMEAVEKALLAYPGSMLIISHDRYLINKLAQRVYYLTSEGLRESLGNYDDFLASQALSPDSRPTSREKEGKSDYQRRKEEAAAQRKRERRLYQLRQEEERLEARLAEIEAVMNQPELAADYQRLAQLQEDKEGLEAELLAALEQEEELNLS